MGEGVVVWRGFTFEANCGSCGGYGESSTQRVRTPGLVRGLAPCHLRGGTIPGDRPSESRGAGLLGVGLWAFVRRPIDTVVMGLLAQQADFAYTCATTTVSVLSPKGFLEG